MREIIRGGTYRDVADGTLVRVSDSYTDLDTSQTIITIVPQTGEAEQLRLTEAEFLERYSLVV